MRDREEVVSLMLSARTIEECEAAGEAARRWRDEHPEDEEYILTAGEQLAMVRAALEQTGGQEGRHESRATS